MTVLVGIRCTNGVVIASDSAATFGAGGQATIGQQTIQKVSLINDSIIYAGTGAVGIAQLIVDSIKNGWDGGAFKGMQTPEQMMGLIGTRIGHVVAPFLQTAQLQRGVTGEANASLCKSMLAMPVKGKLCLFQFDVNGAPELATAQLPFVALGSGQSIADPFLALLKRLLWPNCEPSMSEGRLAAVWAIDHVRRTNPGGVGGDIQLATLSEGESKGSHSVRLAATSDVQEHLEAASNAESALVRQIKGISLIPEAPAIPTFGK